MDTKRKLTACPTVPLNSDSRFASKQGDESKGVWEAPNGWTTDFWASSLFKHRQVKIEPKNHWNNSWTKRYQQRNIQVIQEINLGRTPTHSQPGVVNVVCPPSVDKDNSNSWQNHGPACPGPACFGKHFPMIWLIGQKCGDFWVYWKLPKIWLMWRRGRFLFFAQFH